MKKKLANCNKLINIIIKYITTGVIRNTVYKNKKYDMRTFITVIIEVLRLGITGKL